MGKHIANFACPKCSVSGNGTSAALYQGEGSQNWSCFECKASGIGDPRERGEVHDMTDKSPNDRYPGSFLNKEDVLTFGIRELRTRGISLPVAKHFGIRCSVNETTGEVDKHYFPYYVKAQLAHWKVRELPNKDSGIGSAKKVDPFGWHLLSGGKCLILTEGEYDCASVYQAMLSHIKERGYTGLPQVTSLSAGAASAKAFIQEKGEELSKKYQELILCIDHDEAGDEAVKTISMLYDGPITRMTLPRKDANDTLLEFGEQAIIEAYYKRDVPRLEGMVVASSIVDEAREEETEGIPYKWENMTQGPRGIHFPEVMLLISGTGSGKTDIICENVDHWLTHEDFKIAFHSLEMTRGKTLARILGKALQVPDLTQLSNEAYQNKIENLPKDYLNKLSIFDTRVAELSVDNCLRLIKQEIMSSGATLHIVDNLTCLTEGLANEKQAIDKFIKECKALTMQHGISVIIIMHLNRPKEGGDFESGFEASRNNLYGSASPLKKADTALLLTRNQDHSDPLLRNTTIGKWLKSRDDKGQGTVGTRFALRYDPKTTLMSETEVVNILEKKEEGDF